MNKIILVSCVGQKLPFPAEAKDLYQSVWFKKARAYAEAVGDRWAILSAKYGLILPDRVICPYEMTLNASSRIARRLWGMSVAPAVKVWTLREFGVNLPEIEILAGKCYREFLVPALEEEGFTVSVPMAGLGIGQQLKWLNIKMEMIR